MKFGHDPLQYRCTVNICRKKIHCKPKISKKYDLLIHMKKIIGIMFFPLQQKEC